MDRFDSNAVKDKVKNKVREVSVFGEWWPNRQHENYQTVVGTTNHNSTIHIAQRHWALVMNR